MLTPASSMTSRAESDTRWKTLYRIGGAAALFSAAIIPVQLIVFIAWGQPDSALGWFDMFRESKLAGLLAFEFLFVVNAAVGIATTLSLYVILRRVNESLMAIALVLGLVEAITIILARPAVEMLYLSERYAAAATDAQRASFLAAGEAMWAAVGRHPRHRFPRRLQSLQRLPPDSRGRHAAKRRLRQTDRLRGYPGRHAQLGPLRARDWRIPLDPRRLPCFCDLELTGRPQALATGAY